MAIAFNGVFLSREISALCPALRFNSVALSNIAPDHLLMDKGDTYVDTGVAIVPNNSNLKVEATDMWHPNTELNSDFNGTLEAGRLSAFDESVNGVVIRRTSNRSNFKQWEDVVVFPLQKEDLGSFNKDYDDIFVESGVIYKYAVQPVSGVNRGPMTEPKTIIFDYEYSWLIGEDEKQLMFAYNPVISNFNTMVKDAVIETIGGKYPYVVRNSNVGYKQFQFSALITHFMDIEHTFINDGNMFLVKGSKEDTSINNSATYEAFFKERGMDPSNNYVVEREFRNKLAEFLYDGKPKVFKSDTEGLMLVKLTNISFTPKQELGRTLYDFSCTMTEIGTVDFNTLIDYKLKKGVKVNEL